MIRNIARILAWVTLLVILTATISPLADRPQLGSGPTFERAAAFALLGLLFCVGYRRSWPMALLLVVFVAGGLELAQALTPDRHAKLADALVKAAGGVVGVGMGLIAKRPDARG
ncbi:VanZ family protein [Pseudorhodoplanes sp.]|uniref:VanZ family protein n=1 Tax=Pseudorhodoplanes sp. TaxID=1934341 RepID=UPI002C61DB86|nr:VanZ family protein [Pseudorhodoplanes sp.]HWK68893.1 VanZ family protein [Rhizobiaceae bacterium]HWV41022.1 VanZ family protein [Pseudorhodoplanes sp.]